MLDTPKSNRADVVFQAIKSDILTVRLKPSEKLKINALTEKYDVSLGVVREALSRLVTEDLVQAEPQKGFRVSPIDRNDLIDLTEARISIEQTCLSMSIEQGDVKWEGSVIAAFHCLQNTDDRAPGEPNKLSDEWVEAHSDFHNALVSGCSNSWLNRVRHMLYERAERYRRLSVPLDRTDRNVAAEHQAIKDAVLKRDQSSVRALIRSHLQTTTDIFLKSGIDF
ncbi:MAG: FCD domain-containing protein [Pseudomonadota bacterium]